MTATLAPGAGGRTHLGAIKSPSLVRQVAVLGARSARATLRQPAALFPAMIFPMILLTINSAGLDDATRIPGFPSDSYLDFALTVSFMQAALFATASAGVGLGRDIEGGFINRLALTPMRGAALVLGQLAGAAVIGLLASLVFITVGLIAGVDFKTGVVGVVLLVLLATFTALCLSTIGAFLALRAGSAEAVQGLFPLLFATLFLSTANMPLDLIEADWFRAVAQVNPVTYLVDGMRSLVITGWDTTALARDVGVLVVVSTLGLLGASRALRRRLTRT